ncbi:hypothetical protein FAES_5027 [Fibrella aestuarina BUZ 2]|uniref:Glycosyltransferase RgtA/B/C/D-like domain-containing protein n=1 Tax=Fibrella aestuarina BUZ 2 TaxID=1166018 RepID=I0KFX3_9BACT|nr:hypothetical protein [Fibrella aestuarina]CCH03026.1 hypothetical protein FAES_5027 [Fibrella aestuarina BUZ 2]
MRLSPPTLPEPTVHPLSPYSQPETATLRWSYLAFALSLGFALFISYVRPPLSGYFTTDEQFIADSGVFMLYGATPRCLDWPGIPMVLVFYVLAIGQCGLNLLAAATSGPLTAVDAFGIVDKTVYTYLTDRVPLLVAGRTVQLLLVFGLLFWCIQLIYKSQVALLPRVMRFPLVVLLCLSFDVLAGAPVVRPEGLAYALFAVASLLVLVGNFREGSWRLPVIVLGVMALMISQRLLFVFTFPFLLGGLLLQMGFSLRRAVGTLALLLLCTLLAMPFLFTDSFVVLKAFLGGMLQKVNGAPQPTYFNWTYIRDSVLGTPTVWQAALIVIGSVAFWRFYPKRGVAALLLGNLLFLTVTIFHASKIYHTHTLPIRCLTLFPLLYGLYWLYRATNRIWVMYGLLAIYVMANAYEGWDMVRASFISNPMWDVVTYLKTLPDSKRVLIDPIFDNVAPRSQKTLARELSNIQDMTLTQVKYKRQLGGKVEGDVPIAMVATLSEDERLAVLQRQVLARYTPAGRFPDSFVYTDYPGFVNYFIDKASAMADFDKGQYDYLVTYEALPNRQPVRIFWTEAYWPAFFLYQSPALARQ